MLFMKTMNKEALESIPGVHQHLCHANKTAQTLNDDLVKLHAWSTKWLVNFNPQKTETMTISRKLNKPHQPNLIMNNTIISTVTEHKHLGLQLSDDGNWNKHIDMITKKAFSRVQPQPEHFLVC
jgi:hypothetical protein